jgi:hypothetical protein
MHRLIAVTACAASLSVTACTAGITTAAPAASRTPATSRPATSRPAATAAHSAAASPSPSDTVNVGAPIGSFPIPHGAQVVANMPCGKQVLLELGSVTPAQASAFYASALPRAGYKIQLDTLSSDPNTGTPQGIAEITFTGHGYAGQIIAVANLGAQASADHSLAGLPSNIAKNYVEISLTPPGKTGCPTP